MPAPQTLGTTQARRPILEHVNLMMDTFIANASPDELRAAVRGLLSSSSPAVASTFTDVARRRLAQTTSAPLPPPESLFARRPGSGTLAPSAELRGVLTRARMLYGVGLGFASLKVLALPVRAAAHLCWEPGSELEQVFAEIDADVGQALQSAREELDSGRAGNLQAARTALEELKSAVREGQAAVAGWGEAYPFERAAASLEFWKL
ncbi:uncharacterized protein PHACADRAFT_261592 [Phanerochaete carnosa HHB-10118-sp]|uniref:Uncharacterized protein n=1 Tax=Phanerochaete carnosa (strain HHB-10118-sp) TaxID=650164 RepID=K5VN87_PHACS|nr:uncharacterized protein PHACADRAFT_261592 [Phanerochaete carnosa HHB-10118-sp]EKM52903.1 hypothetical protein PHACADRAFT_261592 [Phanerochaete carnosa HHB-10118-sp]